MYVRKLTIENLRAFGKAEINLAYVGRSQADGFGKMTPWPMRLPNVNVMLGVNGCGKSTILDGIALALLSPLIASSGYRPYALIRRSNHSVVNSAAIAVELVLHKQDDNRPTGRVPVTALLETNIDRRGDVEFVRPAATPGPLWESMYNDSSPAFFFVGYGATRRVEALSANDLASRRKSRQVRYERVASLFEDHFALTPLDAWLPEWQTRNPGRYTQVVNLINKLLPAGIRFTGDLEAGEYLFGMGTVKVPFGALSDGYRAYIGWISDLLYHLCMGAASGAKLVDSKGVVLVDEIDLHIHPGWQRTIIPTLARTLKNLQFIFTTHSPLVVGTLERSNIFNVTRGRGGKPVIARPDEETLGLTADQILRSDVFNLDSTRDPDFRAELDQLSDDAGKGKPGAAIAFMRKAAIGAGDTSALASAPPPAWLMKMAER